MDVSRVVAFSNRTGRFAQNTYHFISKLRLLRVNTVAFAGYGSLEQSAKEATLAYSVNR
jgi:hypothetical protein